MRGNVGPRDAAGLARMGPAHGEMQGVPSAELLEP